MALVALFLAAAVPPLAANPAKPLLMPGKQSLYQRVVAVPGARLTQAPRAGEAGKPVTPFTLFYVYDRRGEGDQAWLQVGLDAHGDIAGWLPARDTLAWNQGLTVVFRDPAGHHRALLFRNRASLEKVIQAGPDAYEKLYQQAVKNQLPPDSPVVAIQPPGYIDIRKAFYLVPILDYRETWLGNDRTRLLRIASVPLAPPQAKPQPKPADEPKKAPPQNDFSAGIVFVIDASLSMDEYIDRTREAVQKIYDQLAESGQLGKVSFGLVAFRDNVDAVPGLDFVARTYVDLQQGENPGVFLEKMQALRAATVSSRDFREDAYAGLREAIEGMDWREHEARFVVLITDAGAREGDDPLSSTHLGTEAIRRLALDNGIAVFVLHLLTPSVKADHERAAAQYKRLSDYPGIGSLYYGVPTGDVKKFGEVVDRLAERLTRQVALATRPPAPEPPPPPVQKAPEAADHALAALEQKVDRLGYALRLKYLHGRDGTVPRVFDAWLPDMDPAEPGRRQVEVRVLLTRDQLSDLHDILRQVLERAEEGVFSPQGFLDELKSLAATVSRNPQALGATTATTAGVSLADLGLIGDYIEGLPYKGEVMQLSLQDWESWPARRQIDFLRRLEEKIAYYQALHDNTDLWISLDGGPVDGDSVYPVPLDMLP